MIYKSLGVDYCFGVFLGEEPGIRLLMLTGGFCIRFSFVPTL